ncbi:MAG: reactive intermediate/imine deaminase [Smithella sp.]|nr:reactive intermediate/imine deaminase [Smithella sp.]
MDKKIITTANVRPAGPYSPAVEAGGFVFLSGRVATDPVTDRLIMEIEPACRQLLQNIKAFLEEIGLSMNHVVKTTVFLRDMRDFAVMNEIYAGFFPEAPPARSTVQVAALPGGAPLEIELIALR